MQSQHIPSQPQWRPQPAELNLVITLMQDPAEGSAGAGAHYSRLIQLKAYPEFSNYLAYILSSLPNESIPNRARAGLLLKNQVKESWNALSPTQHEYIKTQVIQSMNVTDRYLRNVVALIVAMIVQQCKFHGWPGILQHLVSLLDSSDAALQDCSLNALSKISEDCGKQLIVENESLGKPLNFLLPKLIALSTSRNESTRIYALSSLNMFLLEMPMAMIVSLDSYLASLFKLAKEDSSKEVRRRICQAFVSLMEARAASEGNTGTGTNTGTGVPLRPLLPHMDGVINFMLHCCNDDDEDVQLEASEFWSAYCEDELADKALLANYLQPLIQTLIKGMKYSDEEIEAMGGEEEDNSMVPDRAQDIRPQHHKAKAHTAQPRTTITRNNNLSNGASNESDEYGGGVDDDYGEDDWDDDGDDDYDEDWDDDDDASSWTLRKCSAAALDALASTYGPLLFSQLLPIIQPILAKGQSDSTKLNIDRDSWLLLESAILALGAVAQGCLDSIVPHLNDLVPFIFTLLGHRKPLVRSIACWTLSRYSKWIAHTALLQPLVEQLLTCVLDSNKKVQEASCSALATVSEESEQRLIPFLHPIVQTLMLAYTKYQTKNLFMLYDALSTVADSVDSALNNTELIGLLMPPLLTRWHSMKSDDTGIYPLLECLTALARAMGMGFAPYSELVWHRCYTIIGNVVTAKREYKAQRSTHAQGQYDALEPDAEIVSCALDLLSSMTEGMESNIEPLLKQHPNLLQILYECLQDTDPDVRLSGFAFLGDLAKAAFNQLAPVLSYFLPVCASNLNPQYQSLCNNASWSIGELAIQAGSASMAPHIPSLINNLIVLINHQKIPQSLQENAAVTIGRLGLVCPFEVSQRLGEFALQWLRCLELLKVDNFERDHALFGMIEIIHQQPAQMLAPAVFGQLCRTVAAYQPNPHSVDTKLFERLRALMANFKQGLMAMPLPNGSTSQWDALWQQCEPSVRETLQRHYGL